MKNTILFASALFMMTAASAQITTTDSTIVPETTTAYVANPDLLKGLTTETLRPEHSFPALGSYKASGTSTEALTITLDSVNKGMVWVEGLSQGKFKAIMKKAPSTYKIPAQKSESGKSVPEGTLFLNPQSQELTIVLGRPFNDADPTSFSTTVSKGKSKGWQYTGVKAETAAVATPALEQ